MLQECAQRLHSCFTKQIAIYKELDGMAKNLTGQIALSKGDFTQVLPIMEKKKKLLEEISTLKEQAEKDITFWRTHKTEAEENLASNLNETLETMEQTIKRFLISEKQLQKQLEFYRKG